MEVLNILPLVKFKVTDKFEETSSLLTGSEGFISFISSQGSYISTAHTIMTRKGKTGKPRIEKISVHMPIVYDPTVKLRDFYNGCSHMEFEQVKGNALNISNLDFLGWASAYRFLLGHLAKSSTISYSIWSKSNESAVKELYKRFGSDTSHKMDLVSNKDFRQRFIDEMMAVSNILSKDLAQLTEYTSSKMVSDAFKSLRHAFENNLPSKAAQHAEIKDAEKAWLAQQPKK